jgi:hypothetical protein
MVALVVLSLLAAAPASAEEGRGLTLEPYSGASSQYGESSLNFGLGLTHERSGASVTAEWSRYFSDPSYFYLYGQLNGPTLTLRKLGKATLALDTGSLTAELAEDYFSETLETSLKLARPIGPLELSMSIGPTLTLTQKDPESAPLVPGGSARVEGSLTFLKDLCELGVGLGASSYPSEGRLVIDGSVEGSLSCDIPGTDRLLGENRFYLYSSVSQDFAIRGESTQPTFGFDGSLGLGFRATVAD